MTVYVDNMLMTATVGRITSRWSHMFADTTEELNAFAKRLRLNPKWIQYPNTHKEHYDLTENVRLKALSMGAVHLPILTQEWIDFSNRKRLQYGLKPIGKTKPVPPIQETPGPTPTLF